MDNADRAQDYIDWRTEQALAARRKAGQVALSDSPSVCMDCDEPIPAPRRERLPGVRTCVPCQEIREQRARGFR